ncbi:hypothetical protein D3C81_2178550 [compost metagenome]
MQRAVDLAGLLHGHRLEDHRQVEGLYLGLDGVGLHFRGEPVHQVWRIVIDASGEIDRAGGKRRHVRPQRQHPPSLPSRA